MIERAKTPNKLPEIAIWRIKIDPPKSNRLERVDLQPLPQSLDDASQILPPGVYTTFRTFDGDKILSLNSQVNRLEESAALVGHPVQVKIEPLRETLRRVVKRFPSQEKRIRLSIDLAAGDIYILIEPLQVPGKDQYEHGVRLLTVHHKRQNPKAKRTQFIKIASSIRKKYPQEIDDLLMVDDDGFILEGLSSNFFAVLNGEVYTAGEGVLSGITRKVVLEIIDRQQILLHLHPVHISDLERLEEAFLTSASRSVLPIAQIDQYKIAEPVPGPITSIIAKGYWEYVSARLEDL
jgi:branched-chain amino acid aminotransferase